jgi:MFS family permease
MRDPYFVPLFLVGFFASFGYFIPFYFIPSFGLQNGLSSSQGALIVGLLNGGNALGRVLLGLNADILGHLNTLCASLLLGGVATLLLWPFATTLESLTLFAIVYGVFMGGYISLLPSAISKCLGTGNLSIKNGLVYTSFFIGNLIGSPVAGILQDSLTSIVQGVKRTDFIPSMVLCGTVILISFVLMCNIKYRFGSRKWLVNV